MKKKILILVTPAILILALIAAPVLAAIVGQPISNTLTATTTTMELHEQVSMTWSQDGTTFVDTSLALRMVVGVPVTIYVETVSNVDSPIERVRFLAATNGDWYTIEVVGTIITEPAGAEDTWIGVLTYDENEGGYVFGPAEGFTMPAPYVATTELKVTPKVSGERVIAVYAVQLP